MTVKGGFLIIISGPSGVGKSSITSSLFRFFVLGKTQIKAMATAKMADLLRLSTDSLLK